VSVTVEVVQSALKNLIDPNTKIDFVTAKNVRNLKVEGGDISLDIVLGYPAKSQFDTIRKSVINAIRELPDVKNVSVNVTSQIVAHAVQRGVKLLPGVKNIIAIASGKGGVGKSTTAVNLALALAAEGAQVGILDADIYGPSQPMMLGITGRPDSVEENTIEPMEGHGLQASSIGFLIEEDAPHGLAWPHGDIRFRAIVTSNPLA
jgi:ATP-binding protein involved in chromosome partitioning